jgi:hypothetical protein
MLHNFHTRLDDNVFGDVISQHLIGKDPKYATHGFYPCSI